MTFQNLDLTRSGIAGKACSGYCNVQVYGGLFGAGAGNAGFQYFIDDQSSGGRSYVNGVAVFGTTGTELAGIGTLPGGGGDPGDTPPAQVATGDYGNQFLLNLTFANFDAQYHSTVTYDAGGVITAWTRDNGSKNTVGQAGPAAESGSIDDVVGWSRWLDLNNFASNSPNLPNTGNHLLSGTPATSLPTSGTASYALVGATKPTDRAGNIEPGSFTGTLAVDFATRKVGFDFNVVLGAYGWNMKTTGGSANPNSGGYNISASNSFAGNPTVTGTTAASCTTTCFGNVQGMLFGPGATHAGAGYMISDAGPNIIASGVATFGK